MAGGKEIKYQVVVDSSRANRALTQFSRAAQDAGRDAASALDDTASAGDKARAAIETMAQAMDTEIREAAAAAEALSKALGPELAGRMDVATIVGDLNRMGVSFDEVRGDADKFAQTLKGVDDVNLKRVDDEVDRLGQSVVEARDHTDDMGRSAGGAKSSLANMIGNTAQDVSGLSSSLGVAIGQMAEYSADAIFAGDSTRNTFKNMAAVAGPIAGLALITAGIGALKSNLQGLAEQQKKYADDVDKLSEAFVETGDVAETLDDQIRGNILFDKPDDASTFQTLINDLPLVGDALEEQTKAWERVGDPLKSVIAALDNAGITFNDVAAAAEEGGDGMARLRTQLFGLKEAGGITEEQFTFLDEQLGAYQESLFAAEKQTELTSRVMAASTLDVADAIGRFNAEAGQQEGWWADIIRDMGDGEVETVRATKAWNALRTELGLTDEEMAELAQQKLDEKLAADAAAAEALAEGIVAAGQAAQDYNNTVSSAEFGAAGFEAAGTAVSAYFDELFRGGDVMAGQQEAFDGMAASLEAADEAGLSWFETLTSVNSPEGRQVRTSMRQLADSLIPDIQQAYVDADGDQAQFQANMSELATGVLSQMQTELGLTTDEANALGQQLGLTPEMVQTTFEMIGIEEARLKIGLLQGSIDDLPEDVQTTVTQQIIMGDYQGALDTIQAYYDSVGASIPVDADLTRAYQAIANFAAYIRGLRLLASVAASYSTNATASSVSTAPTSAAARGVGAAPMAAGPTQLNVHIHAAAVGNRYDVERVVAGAVRQSIRLAGRRNGIAVPA